MKKFLAGLVGLATVAFAVVCFAAPREDVDLNVWRINGTQVKATAAELNRLTNGTACTETVTPQTVSPTYAATNAPAITVTLQTTTAFDSTGAAVTNAAGAAVVFVTNATATCAGLTAATARALMTNVTVVVTYP